MRTSMACLLALALSSAPALAADRVVDNLSDGALLGQVTSTADLQRAFTTHETTLARAGSDIGLSAAQFAQVRRAIERGDARYVELPRHIDAMSGAHDGHVFAVKSIRIPAGVYGWRVDLREPTRIVHVYVPNRCGNLSLVRSPRARVLAVAPVYRHHVAAVAPASFATPPPFAFDAPAAVTPVAYVAPPPAITLPEIASVPARHFGFLPLLLGGVVAGFLSNGGHGSGGSSVVIGRPPVRGILPPTLIGHPPVSCPTPAPKS